MIGQISGRSAFDLLKAEHPLIIGHRGSCATAPENTLASFKLALAAGADAIELDYHHSKDGVPVVIHDAFLERTTDIPKHRRRIPVHDKTVPELHALDAGIWFDEKFAGERIPLLAEALKFIQRAGGISLVERKAGDPVTCARLLNGLGLINKVVVISFDWQFVSDLHKLLPEQVLGVLGPPISSLNTQACLSKQLSARWLTATKETGAELIVWNQNVSSGSIRLAHQLGFKVWVYTIDSAKGARHLVEKGVDGIITNDPSAMVEVFRRERNRASSAALASQRKETGR